MEAARRGGAASLRRWRRHCQWRTEHNTRGGDFVKHTMILCEAAAPPGRAPRESGKIVSEKNEGKGGKRAFQSSQMENQLSAFTLRLLNRWRSKRQRYDLLRPVLLWPSPTWPVYLGQAYLGGALCCVCVCVCLCVLCVLCVRLGCVGCVRP